MSISPRQRCRCCVIVDDETVDERLVQNCHALIRCIRFQLPISAKSIRLHKLHHAQQYRRQMKHHSTRKTRKFFRAVKLENSVMELHMQMFSRKQTNTLMQIIVTELVRANSVFSAHKQNKRAMCHGNITSWAAGRLHTIHGSATCSTCAAMAWPTGTSTSHTGP